MFIMTTSSVTIFVLASRKTKTDNLIFNNTILTFIKSFLGAEFLYILHHQHLRFRIIRSCSPFHAEVYWL